MVDLFEQTIQSYIRQNELLSPGEHVLVGVSGGADSLCLLLLLLRLKKDMQLTVTAAHVNHGIRAEAADADEEFVRTWCESHGIPLHCRLADVPAYAKKHGISTEEAGRDIRYQYFDELADDLGADKIAVAHHLDDNAETILWNLFRGSGLTGASGIAPQRGRIIRPLLETSRAAIEEWLSRNQQTWCMDATNAELDYTRNRIRNAVMPYVTEHINKQAPKHLAQTGMLLGEIDIYMKEEAAHWISQHARIEPGMAELSLVPLKETAMAHRRYIIRQSLKRCMGGLRDVGLIHVKGILELIDGQAGRQINLPGGIVAVKTSERIKIGKDSVWGDADGPLHYKITVLARKKGQKIPDSPCVKWFDYDTIKGMVCCRNRRTGDRISVLAMNAEKSYGSKKLKDYMIDAKIPRKEREFVRVFADGQEIMWVVGHRMSEAYKVTADTRNILQIEMFDTQEERDRKDGK